MVATYAAVLAVCAVAPAIGQAALALCGVRRWSWLAPAVGLSLLAAACWGAVRLDGDGVSSVFAAVALFFASLAYLRGRVTGKWAAMRAGTPVALIALLAASLPFLAEGHFGILGTSFNPDMSQHLLATGRLAHDGSSELLRQGYPLGPHAIVVALDKGLGVGLVHGFSGLTIAVAVLAPLTALAAFEKLPALPRTAAALVVGLAYVVSSYFAQGAFKETMQALVLLAFVLSLREASQTWLNLPLRFVPAALLAAGSVYVYSFPGLIWLGGAAAIWTLMELLAGPAATPPAARALGPNPLRAALLGLLPFTLLVVPELTRMLTFRRFETFNPDGAGLGNLFGQVSPFEALGIWPSGDFRLSPGAGAVPAAVYFLGVAFGLALLAYGAARCWRRHERAVLAGVAAAVLAYLAARLGGTPYTAAKAIEVGSPLVALTIQLPAKWTTSRAAAGGAVGGPMSEEALATGGHGGSPAATGPAVARLAHAFFIVAAGACSLLALANAPVGPTRYSPALTRLRPLVDEGATLVLAPRHLLADEHGAPYLSWELRGGRVCVRAAGRVGERPPRGVRFVVTESLPQPPYSRLRYRRTAGPYVLWERSGPVAGRSSCPLVAVRQARQDPTL